MRVTFIAVAAFAACVAAIPASQARAQSASELVAKNAAARGGALKLAAITSIRFAGKLVVPGDLELQYSETRARHNGQARYESSLQGLTLVQGYDGKTAWRINPFEGRRDAERMSEDDMRALADDATIDGPLLSANARRSTVSYLGREDLKGPTRSSCAYAWRTVRNTCISSIPTRSWKSKWSRRASCAERARSH